MLAGDYLNVESFQITHREQELAPTFALRFIVTCVHFYDTQQRFNQKWLAKYDQFKSYSYPPWWAPGLILNDEIRGNYERYLPISEYLQDLRDLLLPFLSAQTWLPRVLYDGEIQSLPDLWKLLPEHLAGKIIWDNKDLLPLGCALASPSKNGTSLGRYPEQIEYLSSNFIPSQSGNLLALDMGCSTGQGTYELATTLEQHIEKWFVLGITNEPLEAWMAATRNFPHQIPDTTSETRTVSSLIKRSVSFISADIMNFAVSTPVDLILCNGLIGGPNLRNEKDYPKLWNVLSSQLKKGGMLLIGNRFHEGYKAHEERFLDLMPSTMRLADYRGNSRFYERLLL